MYFEKEILDKIPTEYLLSSFEATKLCMRNELRMFELTDQQLVDFVLRPDFENWCQEQCDEAYGQAREKVTEVRNFKKDEELTDEQRAELLLVNCAFEKDLDKYRELSRFSGVWEGYLTALCNTYLGRYILSGGSCVAEINVADEFLFTIDNEKITVAGSFGAKREIDYRKNIEYYDCLFDKVQPSNNNDDNWDK